MRTYLDCYPCFVRQALDAARMAEADDQQQKAVLNRVLGLLQRTDTTNVPPAIGSQVHRIVREHTGNPDPYREVKFSSTLRALALYPWLTGIRDQAADRLDAALRLSIAGNIIDAGPAADYDLQKTVERVLRQPFALDDRATFRHALGRADHVLFLADNAGETVFDRLLVEELPVPTLYAVKGAPVLNDATSEDAHAAGVGEAAEIVDTGSDSAGTILGDCSPEFLTMFRNAGLIIAKGQANYETLSDHSANVFFLLQVKCPVIAQDISVPVGSIVLSRGGHHD